MKIPKGFFYSNLTLKIIIQVLQKRAKHIF